LSQLSVFAEDRPADVVLSDMLGNSCGDRGTDHFRSIELVEQAMVFCDGNLRQGGAFLCKYLRGSEEKELLLAAKEVFREVKAVKPAASRSESSEMYLLARGKR
jgi:23S rRNA (uridine2552-2'-O)-methyltransferase